MIYNIQYDTVYTVTFAYINFLFQTRDFKDIKAYTFRYSIARVSVILMYETFFVSRDILLRRLLSLLWRHKKRNFFMWSCVSSWPEYEECHPTYCNAGYSSDNDIIHCLPFYIYSILKWFCALYFLGRLFLEILSVNEANLNSRGNIYR